jgi:hypothetical protein
MVADFKTAFHYSDKEVVIIKEQTLKVNFTFIPVGFQS